MPILNRIKNAWNAFRDSTTNQDYSYIGGGSISSTKPDRVRLRYSSERSIIASIFTRISIDVASVNIKHIKVDDNDRFEKEIDSGLNDCLVFEPNLDQGPRAFRQDIVMTLFDKGACAIVPVETSTNPSSSKDYEIYSLRVGEIVSWYPKHVRVSLYNEEKGLREEVIVSKKSTAIIENPLYNVMNEPNSTLQRLIRKLNLLDVVDEESGSGKLDLIIQLPYVVKTETRRQQAEKRREEIEFQLKDSRYGIAYTDGSERITQLNRPAENNLLAQVERLTSMLYSQLGITDEVMDGTANEKTMLNYFNRTIEPILDAIVEAIQRSFIGAGRSKMGEKVRYLRNPFKLVPVNDIAEIADKFTRNEILTSNEIRSVIGFKPADDPKADELRNSNMPQPAENNEHYE